MMDEDFINRLKSGKKLDCPCCGRYAQIYARSLHSNAAAKLIKLERLGGRNEYIHTSRLLLDGDTGIGDFSKAKYWGLIIECENNWEHKRTSGNWMLTTKGVGFVLGKLTIPRKVFVFDDTALGYSDDQVSIHDCLASGGFDYSELMNKIY